VGALRDANREGRNRDTTTVEYLHRVNESHSFFAQQVFVRNQTVFKNNARRL
jgi:hypothetical protein